LGPEVPSPAAEPICAPDQTAIVVDTAVHQLSLCERGARKRSFSIALGRNGTGKRSAGDRKTPLGTYALGTPRPSDRFGIFIPVGYPTAEQARRGLSGGEIGVHGPRRNLRWLGRLHNLFDWTRGCIAVASDSEIAEIADWVAGLHVAIIHLR
jgi:murein L,D-transpeptidase YafK